MGSADQPAGPPNVSEPEPPAPGITGAPDAGEQDGARPEDAVSEDDAATVALERDLAAMQQDLRDATERHLRLAAEFDNFRRRNERERAETWTRAQGELASRLLDSLDDLERVVQHGQAQNAAALLEGVQLVERKLRNALAAAGLEDIEAENASFDPNSMEAVAMVPAESPEDDDVVSDVFQRGYRFKGTLLRPARVRVKKHH